MRVLLIEDEVPAREQLRRLLKVERADAEVVGELTGVAEAVAWLRAHPSPDLILCDIQLADGLSLRIFDEVEVSAPVIFCTAYDEHWTDAFRANGIDYLLKPIEPGRFREALEKYGTLERHFGSRLRALAESHRARNPRARMVLRRGSSFVAVPVAELAWLSTEHGLITLMDRSGQTWFLDRPLAEVYAELDPAAFFRANRQFVIALPAVKAFRSGGRGKLLVEVEHCPSAVVVAQENASAFRAWLDR